MSEGLAIGVGLGGVDREQDEVRMLLQRREQAALRLLQADGDGLAAELRVEFLSPGLDGFGRVEQCAVLHGLAVEVGDFMLLIGPVNAEERDIGTGGAAGRAGGRNRTGASGTFLLSLAKHGNAS
jgi:hypothetical protein